MVVLCLAASSTQRLPIVNPALAAQEPQKKERTTDLTGQIGDIRNNYGIILASFGLREEGRHPQPQGKCSGSVPLHFAGS